ncbi:nitrilase-related carbon-nitrogen hydrolase [Microcella sp.]|uniref:nitrilase-related carbon-nitrogen hydrolase n=1 Tax=Microcella sp. TaxID=1913979 RepID=UPI00391B068D
MTAAIPFTEATSSARQVRIRCHELAPRIADKAANGELIESAIREAVADGIELLVLPELATSGYYLTAEEARACAIDADDGVWAQWCSSLGPNTTVVVGFAERANETIYNSAAVLTAAGVAGVYRKTHLWDAEQHIFAAGNQPPPVIDTPVGRVGVLICYDLEFPEMPRSLALEGADIIAVPTNWPVVPKPASEHAPEVIQAMAAARSSCVAIACCDRSGEERGKAWTQGTSVIGADGWLAGTRSENRVDATVEIADARAQIGPLNNVLSDRRPELYFRG